MNFISLVSDTVHFTLFDETYNRPADGCLSIFSFVPSFVCPNSAVHISYPSRPPAGSRTIAYSSLFFRYKGEVKVNCVGADASDDALTSFGYNVTVLNGNITSPGFPFTV